MAIWFWLALGLNVVGWSIFFYLISRRSWNLAALTVGTLHMLFSVVVSVAPFRSFLEPNYVGLGLGFLRFDGIAATLAATLIYAWAALSAWLAVSKGKGHWMLLMLIGDLFLALNFGGSTLLEGSSDNWRIDFGEGKSITGFAGALILLVFFTFPFVASAIWAARRSRWIRPSRLLVSDLQEKADDTEDHTSDMNRFRLSESLV